MSVAFDKAWDVVKDVDFGKIKAGEPCYACHMEEIPERCEGAKWSYHGGAGGLFTYCEPQMKKVVQATKDDPSLQSNPRLNEETGQFEHDPEAYEKYGEWYDDLQEM